MSTENAKKTVLFNKSHIDNLKLRIDTLQKDLEQKVTDLEKTINETINKKIQAIESEITTLKKSVSDGKKTLTTTITGYGQAVSDSDSDGVSEFSEINTGIVGLMNYGNATEAYVYPNKTFTAGGKRRTGNMSLARSETISVNSISTSLPNKYYEGCTINAQAVYNNGYDSGITGKYELIARLIIPIDSSISIDTYNANRICTTAYGGNSQGQLKVLDSYNRVLTVYTNSIEPFLSVQMETLDASAVKLCYTNSAGGDNDYITVYLYRYYD